MNFKKTFKDDKGFDKKDLQDILKYSKAENKKYLYQILSIKKISAFDVGYIMNKLNLTDEKIQLINLALAQYDQKEGLRETESYNDFLFRIVRNIEKLENTNAKLLEELTKCKDELNNFSSFIDFLIVQSSFLLENALSNKSKQGYVFSKVYIDD